MIHADFSLALYVKFLAISISGIFFIEKLNQYEFLGGFFYSLLFHWFSSLQMLIGKHLSVNDELHLEWSCSNQRKWMFDKLCLLRYLTLRVWLLGDIIISLYLHFLSHAIIACNNRRLGVQRKRHKVAELELIERKCKSCTQLLIYFFI